MIAWNLSLGVHFLTVHSVWIKISVNRSSGLYLHVLPIPEHTQERKDAVLLPSSTIQDRNTGGEFEYAESTNTLEWVLNATSVNRLRDTGLSFMLSFHYAEQLTCASSHFVELVNLAVHWNMTAVEPLVKNSRLFGFHGSSKSWQQDPSYWYGRLFNLTLANEKLSNCLLGTTYTSNSSIILPFHDFLLNSYRSITVVLFVHGHSPTYIKDDILGDVENKVFQSKLDSKGNMTSIVDCTLEGKNTATMKTVESLLNLEASTSSKVEANFVVSRMICVNSSDVISLIDLKEAVFPSQIHNESVVFLFWQGLRTVYKFQEENVLHKCHLNFPHSNEVVKTSQQFIQSLSLKRPFLSVHMRTEKLLKHEITHPGYFNCCIERLHSMINATIEKYKLKSVLILRDYGTYGTDACLYDGKWLPSNICKEQSDKAVERLNQWGIPVVEFDPAAFHAPKNAGFVSLVEADALLQGDVLINLGCGSFQHNIIQKFIHKYSNETDPKARCYSVCPCLQGIGWVHGLNIEPKCLTA